MSQKLYCPMCHQSLIKSDVDGLIDELFIENGKKVVFDLRKLKDVDPSRIKKVVCYNCKRRLKYYIEE